MQVVTRRSAALPAAIALFAALAIGRQPAAALSENITVVVVEESAPYALVPGAVVTLRGTDPSSLGGLVLTTGAAGTVTFVGVTGPYSVTAQKDFVIGGFTSRFACSVVDIAPVVSGVPATGSVGLLIEKPEDLPPTPPATLTGTIANVPALPPGQVLEVVAVARGNGESVGWADGSAGFYSMSIPSGTVVDCIVAHRTSFGSAPVLASLIATGVGPAAPFSVLTRNFNFASAVPWATTVNVTESGRKPGLWIGVQLVVRDPATGVDVDFSIHDSPGAPATIKLPNLTHPSFAGFRVELSADTYDPFDVVPGEQEREFWLTSTPASVHFDFMPVPTPVQPVDGTLLSPSALANLALQFTQGAPPAGFGINGINGFFLESDEFDPCPPSAGIDNAGWAIFARGGSQSFAMPPSSLPMFATGQSLYAGFFQYRVKGFGFGYESFFDANLAAHLAALDSSITEACDSETVIGLTLDTDTYCTAGTSASGCQALLSTSGFASASAPSGFAVQAAGVEGNKAGIFFFGANGRQMNPWGAGSSVQCVAPPVKRTGILAMSGTTGACDGAFLQDLNAYWTAEPLNNPGAGARVQLQLWYRDPQNPSGQTTSLSNAIEFCVQP